MLSLFSSFLYLRTRLSLENELLHDETAQGSGMSEESKTDDSSGEGGGSGDDTSSHDKQEPDRPVIIQKPLKPAKPVSVQAPAKHTSVQAPAKPASVQTAAKPASVQTPAKPASVQTAAKPASVQTPAKLSSNKTSPGINTKPTKRNSVQIPKKPASVEAKKETQLKIAVTDKRFSKLIGSNVACRLVGKKGLKNGILKWVGHLPKLPLDNAHLIAGVELLTDDKLGTDGTYRGVRYFKSSPRRGYFFRLKDCKAKKH